MLTTSGEISSVSPDKQATEVSKFSAIDIMTCGDGLRSPASYLTQDAAVKPIRLAASALEMLSFSLADLMISDMKRMALNSDMHEN